MLGLSHGQLCEIMLGVSHGNFVYDQAYRKQNDKDNYSLTKPKFGFKCNQPHLTLKITNLEQAFGERMLTFTKPHSLLQTLNVTATFLILKG